MIKINIIFQPKGSRTCGQHCVAMICGITVNKSIYTIKKSGATRTCDLHNAFSVFGYKSDEKLTRIKNDTVLPGLCILKVTWKIKGSHWVIYNDGIIYCPVNGCYEFNQYLYNIKGKGKITSYLPVYEPLPAAA